jgi:hypothetical protein
MKPRARDARAGSPLSVISCSEIGRGLSLSRWVITRRMRTVRKAVVVLLVALAFTPLVSLLTVERYYFNTRPEHPDLQSGRVYAERLKGGPGEDIRTVYLTRLEDFPTAHAGWVMPISMLFAAAAYVLNKRWHCLAPLTMNTTDLTNR